MFKLIFQYQNNRLKLNRGLEALFKNPIKCSN